MRGGGTAELILSEPFHNTSIATAIPTQFTSHLIPRATALLDFDIISWKSREAPLSL